MALHLFLYVFLSVEFEIGSVAVVHCLLKKTTTKNNTNNVACSSLQRFQGWLSLKQYSMEFVVPMQMISISYASMPKHESSYGCFVSSPLLINEI